MSGCRTYPEQHREAYMWSQDMMEVTHIGKSKVKYVSHMTQEPVLPATVTEKIQGQWKFQPQIRTADNRNRQHTQSSEWKLCEDMAIIGCCAMPIGKALPQFQQIIKLLKYQ